MSFRSSDVSIKCRLIKYRSINCQVMKKYTDKNENNSKILQFTNCCKLQQPTQFKTIQIHTIF